MEGRMCIYSGCVQEVILVVGIGRAANVIFLGEGSSLPESSVHIQLDEVCGHDDLIPVLGTK